MRDAWRSLRRRVNELLVEGLARGFVLYGFAWLLGQMWRDQLRARHGH